MSCTRPQRIKMLGKDSSHSFGMTMRVISNEVRDPSLIPFSKDRHDFVYAVALRDLNFWKIHSKRNAPTIEPIQPAPWPASYQPTA